VAPCAGWPCGIVLLPLAAEGMGEARNNFGTAGGEKFCKSTRHVTLAMLLREFADIGGHMVGVMPRFLGFLWYKEQWKVSFIQSCNGLQPARLASYDISTLVTLAQLHPSLLQIPNSLFILGQPHWEDHRLDFPAAASRVTVFSHSSLAV